MSELDDKIFNEYIEHKRDCVTGIMEEGMKAGFFDWENCKKPTGVRNYVKEVLFNLVLIHSEVHAVSSQIVSRVLSRLVDMLSEEFYNLIREVENFSFQGIIYVYIEMACLEEVLEPYLTEESLTHFDDCRAYLADWDVQEDESVHKIVDAFKEKTKLQLRCFRLAHLEETVEEEEEEFSISPSLALPPSVSQPLPEQKPKIESSFVKARDPPKEEIKTPKKEKVEEPPDEFKKVRKYKPMPEGF